MIIKEIMNKAIVVDHDISLKEAAKIMSDKNIGSLVVIKGENIYGIVTEHDIMTNANNLNKKISSIMSKNVLTINENEDIDEAALINLGLVTFGIINYGYGKVKKAIVDNISYRQYSNL